ncbi:MAG TPA: DUF86 domain-containing protein [bacterium]|nr:DUF86 domain-containing protein [bacterium]
MYEQKKRSDEDLLCDVKEAIKRIEDFTGQISYEEFMKDKKSQSAVAWEIGIIGEASHNLSDDFKKKHNSPDWEKAYSMRNRITHGYFDIDFDIVWSTIKNDLPDLKQKLENILSSVEEEKELPHN